MINLEATKRVDLTLSMSEGDIERLMTRLIDEKLSRMITKDEIRMQIFDEKVIGEIAEVVKSRIILDLMKPKPRGEDNVSGLRGNDSE